jgi:uncharacterized protein
MNVRQGLALAVLLLAGSPAAAASFDCTKARTPDEKAICTDRSLNDKDVRMALLFDLDRRLMAMGSRDAMRDDQSAWLVQRRRCGADRICLHRSYDRRIAVLRGIIDTRVTPRGPF